jgi:thiol-disulfide isomerase/thioredoxin
MKALNFILFFLIFSLVSCSKIDTRSIDVVFVRADWCPVSKKIEPSIQELSKEVFSKNKHIKFVIFDQTNLATLKLSSDLASKEGLTKIFEYEKNTGEILFVDKVSKIILARFYDFGDKEELVNITEKLLKSKFVKSIPAKSKSFDHPVHNMEVIKKAKLWLIQIHHDSSKKCVITAPVFEAVYKDFQKNPDLAFVTFDLTNEASIKKSKKLAKSLGLLELFDAEKHAGEVLFVDANSKAIKSRLVADINRWNYHAIIKKTLASLPVATK